VLAIKGNQKTLFEDIQLLVDDPEAVPDDAAQTVDGDHGRIETRRAAVLHDVAWLAPSGTAFPPARKDLARMMLSAKRRNRANQDKGSTRGKIKRAAWDDAFLLKLLAAA
jgi:hypothetical protein